MRLHRGCSPRATPGATDRELLPAGENQCLSTETEHILRDDETASLLLTVSYSRATKAPTPWHTGLHPDTSRSKISEQQCLAGPGSPHNDRSDGKPNSSWPGLLADQVPADSGGNPQFRRKSRGFRRKSGQKFNKSKYCKYDTNMTFAKYDKFCHIICLR